MEVVLQSGTDRAPEKCGPMSPPEKPPRRPPRPRSAQSQNHNPNNNNNNDDDGELPPPQTCCHSLAEKVINLSVESADSDADGDVFMPEVAKVKVPPPRPKPPRPPRPAEDALNKLNSVDAGDVPVAPQFESVTEESRL